MAVIMKGAGEDATEEFLTFVSYATREPRWRDQFLAVGRSSQNLVHWPVKFDLAPAQGTAAAGAKFRPRDVR